MTGGAKVYDMPPRDAATPDHDLYAESVVMAALLLGDVAPAALQDQLAPADLYDRRHKAIFEAATSLAAGGTTVDLAGVAAWLRAAGRLGEVGIPYLTTLSDVPAGEIEGPLSTIRESARVRRMEQALGYAAARLRGPQRDRAGLLAEVAELVGRATAEAPRKGHGLPVQTAAAWVGSPPAPRFLAERLHLAPGRPAVVVGYAGTGKTNLVADLVLAVAGGPEHRSFWGGLRVDRQGRALHLDFEVGRSSTWRRYQRLAAGRWGKVTDWGDRLAWASYPAFHLGQKDAEGVLLRTVEGFDLVVIDSLKKLMPGVDENDARAADGLGILARVSEATGAAFVLLHHEGKPPQDGPREARFRGRGSSAIQGEWSSQWAVSVREGRLILEHGKSEHGALQPSWSCKLVDTGARDETTGVSEGLRFEPVGEVAEGGEEVTDPGTAQRLRRAVLTILESMGALTSKDLHAELKHVKGATNAKFVAVHDLEREGRIRSAQQGRSKVWELTPTESGPTVTSGRGNRREVDEGEEVDGVRLPRLPRTGR